MSVLAFLAWWAALSGVTLGLFAYVKARDRKKYDSRTTQPKKRDHHGRG